MAVKPNQPTSNALRDLQDYVKRGAQWLGLRPADQPTDEADRKKKKIRREGQGILRALSPEDKPNDLP